MAQDKKRKRLQVDTILPSKRSKLTQSTKNYTYQSFTNRIASLKIEPVRRNHAKNIVMEETIADTTSSHFKTSLDNWSELNLSDNFSSFSKSVSPLSDNLVQLLHHADEIFALLVNHIKQGNALSLQPLLDLMAQFARDLGVHFEKYFPDAFEVISKLAASDHDIQVIEWSFNCFAWLFKYLSKLLVPDLRPTYDALAPLLGKTKQKVFVSRFAAEALSFLIRRASVSYHSNSGWLQRIIEHIVLDVQRSGDIRSLEQFELGLVTLFSEAIKGSKETLSSNGSHIFAELLRCCLIHSSQAYATDPAYQVLQGTVSAILHATNSISFATLLQIILDYPSISDHDANVRHISIRLRLLAQIVYYKSGASITNWSALFQFLEKSMTDPDSLDQSLAPELVGVIAVCHNVCSIDVAIRHVRIIEILNDAQWNHYFIPFCDLYSRYSNGRFKNFIIQSLQSFINRHWQTHELELADMIPRLQSRHSQSGIFDIPQKWKDSLLKALDDVGRDITVSSDSVIRLFAISEMAAAIIDREFATTYISKLWKILVYHVAQSPPLVHEILVLIFGRLLNLVIDLDTSAINVSEVSILLSSNAHRLSTYPTFWKSAADLAHLDTLAKNDSSQVQIVQDIYSALESSSHDVRTHALRTLTVKHSKSIGIQSELLSVASTIEATAPTIDTFRMISTQIRKLGGLYASQITDPCLQLAIPSYYFGLVRARYAPVWEAAVSAIESICDTKQGAEIVGDITIRWLSQTVAADDKRDGVTPTLSSAAPQDIDAFTELLDVDFRSRPEPLARIRQEFDLAHPTADGVTTRDRAQVLSVLKAVPHVAEKRSRALVPILLEWVRAYAANADTDHVIGNTLVSQDLWSRQDLKSLLSIFATFANPKSMYRSEDVHSACLLLLSHGDIDIQRQALKAVLSRKNSNINRYRENLLNLLDDDKLKDQFSSFLTIGSGDDSLQDEHRVDVMPVVLRILYGRIISRSKGDKQRAIKRAVFDLVSRLGEDEANCFLDIALGPLNGINVLEYQDFLDNSQTSARVAPRKQVGLLNMLNGYLGFLGATTSTYAHRLIDPVLYCLLRAVQQDESSPSEDELSRLSSSKSINKSIRTSALQCLNRLFEISLQHDWTIYVQIIWKRLIIGRLVNFQQESTEGVSWLLRLFATWAAVPQYVGFLTDRDGQLLARLAQCIGSSVTKEVVKSFTVSKIFLPVLQNLESAEVTEHIFGQVLSCSSELLINLEHALASACSKDLLNDTVKLISRLSSLTTISSPELIRTCCALVRQPAQNVSVSCKQTLLRILEDAVSTATPQAQLADIFDLLCSSFLRGISEESRLTLVGIALKLAEHDQSIKTAVDIVEELNSFSTSRLDEPDYARREKAFGQIANADSRFNTREWALLLSNAVYFTTDVDELSIRASAAHCVRRFITVTAESEPSEREQYSKILRDIIFTSIEKGIKDKPEIVRVEYLSILAEIIKVLPSWDRTSDLAHLVWSNDEEASFFINILHIQQHRRIRAMGRLQEEVQKGTLTSKNIAHLLIPLLEHFVFDHSRAGEVAGEASKTVGKLAEWIDFPQFRSLFKRYISYLQNKPESQEVILRLLENVATAFGNAHHARISAHPASTLSKSLPKEETLATAVLQDFMPPLVRFLQEKDESFVSRRVAAVVVAARILQVLPERDFALKFPPLLTDTCNIMRSRDQNSRDMTRKALMSVCIIIGPNAFNFVVKELRRALQRGFFLHVLGYSVHALLESVMEQYQPGDLDHCITIIMEVVMDDIFGVTGQEKEAAEFLRDSQSKKEVKSRKSFDTIQMLASITSTQYLIELIRPIKELLLERLPQKMMPHVDELLRRVEVGIAQSRCITNTDTLSFCYQIYQDAFRDVEANVEIVQPAKSIDAPMPDRHTERKKASTSSQKEKLGKIARFSLDLLRSVLRKHKELKTRDNIAGFLPIIKDALVQDSEDTKLAALRLFASIVTVPLHRIDLDAPIYITEAVKIIESSHNAKDELAQGALKLVATILRERKTVKVANTTVVSLLKKIKPDLQIISQQGVAFNLVKSVMSRKIVVPEVYDLMDGDDGIAAIAVRDHDRTTRDLARGVYIQFVIEYPQAQKRFDNQLKFLLRNLEYEYSEGRMSVMEALNTLHLKLGDKLVQVVVTKSFWPVVSVLTNDESADCRIMAQGLLKTILSRANDVWLDTFMITIQKLLHTDSRISQQTALQCWTMYLEVHTTEAKGVESMLVSLQQLLATNYDDPADVWQIRFYALGALHEICRTLPLAGLSSTALELWKLAYTQLSFPHAWVKHEASKLVGLLFSYLSKEQTALAALPLVTSYGLSIGKGDLFDLTRRHTLAIREGITQDFASQLIRNLLFIGRCFNETDLRWPTIHANGQNGMYEREDASSDDDESATSLEATGEQSALAFLFTRAANLLRRESHKRVSGDQLASRRATALIPRASALQLIAALVATLPLENIQPSTKTILVPLVRLTDTNTTPPVSSDPDFAEAYSTLVTNATELLDILQDKLGTTEFVSQLSDVKRAVREKRDERRVKRRVEIIRNPQLVEKKRIHKREKEKVRRKEKSEMHRGRRRGW